MVAIVTDNAANMKKMRSLVQTNKPNLIQYGCSAHQLNLLSKDLNRTIVVQSVAEITKSFRNTHLLHSWLQNQGATKPPVPSEVRWNSYIDLLRWYEREWYNLKKIVDENAEYFSGNAVASKIKDLMLYQAVEDAIKCLTPISVALDVIQSGYCSVADAVEAWKDVLAAFRTFSESDYGKVEKRYKEAVLPVWFVSNILHPKYLGQRLQREETKQAIEWVQKNANDSYSCFVNFIGGDKSNFASAFQNYSGCKLRNFVECQKSIGEISDNLATLCCTCLALRPSSAGIERIFSSMGLVHSELRNRLSQEKVSKLAFCLRLLNDHN